MMGYSIVSLSGCGPYCRSIVSDATRPLKNPVNLTLSDSSHWPVFAKMWSRGRLRDELLNRELFLSMEEARWVIDRWQLDYNHRRIHSALDYQTPAAYAADCVPPASAAPLPTKHSRTT